MDDRETLKGLKTTQLRFSAMREDYKRQADGIETMLVVDTCDLLKYMHIVKDRGLTLQERAVSRLFDDDTLERVLLAPHAYELLHYIFNVLLSVQRIKSGRASISLYRNEVPAVDEFMKSFEDGNHDRAAMLWKQGAWAGLVEIAKDGGRGADKMIRKPLRVLFNLIERRAIFPINELGLPESDVVGSFASDTVVNRVLDKFKDIEDRTSKDLNNLVDARALGITIGLNERYQANKKYFSVTTLSGASLTAYSRSFPRGTKSMSSICRNTSVSAYRYNLKDLREASRDPLAYMRRGTHLLSSVIEGFPAFMRAARNAKSGGSVPGDDGPRTLRYLANFLEYHEDYFRKLILPVTAVPTPDDSAHQIAGAYEVLSDERQYQDSMRVAHRAIYSEAKTLAERLRPFVSGSNGSLAEDVKIGDQSVAQRFSQIVQRLEREGDI